jgi:hypothetical protein
MSDADAAFVRDFEAGVLPNAGFRHRDHVRLAWIYVRQLGPDAAEDRIVDGIRCFARRVSHEAKFHDTMTRAWLRLVAAAVAMSPQLSDYDSFAAAHGWLLDTRALETFYSAERLQSDAARHGWIEPDRQPLPDASATLE